MGKFIEFQDVLHSFRAIRWIGLPPLRPHRDKILPHRTYRAISESTIPRGNLSTCKWTCESSQQESKMSSGASDARPGKSSRQIRSTRWKRPPPPCGSSTWTYQWRWRRVCRLSGGTRQYLTTTCHLIGSPLSGSLWIGSPCTSM